MKTYRWNKIITAASLMAAAAMLGACSSQTAAPAQTQAAPETENTSAAEAADTSAAEKWNPQWDVVWIDSMYDVYTLSQDGQLMTDWEPENAANLTGFSKNLVMESRSSWCWQVLPRRFR